MAATLLLRRRRPQLLPYTCLHCLRRLSQASPASNAELLPPFPTRTRFAPSPTGNLHLGSLRTALFNYLLAKRTSGQFILRIEDTDQKRTVPGAEQGIVRDLQWARLQWDEGPDVGGPKGPYRQSERTEIYREHVQKLMHSGDGYRCFCSTERLAELAQFRHKLGLATEYDRKCASIPTEESDDRASKGEKHTIRFRTPNQYPRWNDLVHGVFKPPYRRGRFDQMAFEDPILLKSDGFPTYHLANVVDDHLMEITHVIRGSEWMPTTNYHVAMYNAFQWTPPQFAHVGLLVDSDGNKLSKRNFDTDISAYKEMEIFPETMTNFVALLGWSHREKDDIMDLKALIKNFNLKFTRGNTAVTFGKMHFLQRRHAVTRAERGGPPLNEMVHNIIDVLDSPEGQQLYPDWKSRFVSSSTPDSDSEAPAPAATEAPAEAPAQSYIASIIRADSGNYTNANEFLYRNAFFFLVDLPQPKSSTDTPLFPDDIPPRMRMLADVSENDWSRRPLELRMHDIIDGRSEGRSGAKHVYKFLRWALTRQEQGMRIYDIMIILGRRETLRRVEQMVSAWEEEQGVGGGQEEQGVVGGPEERSVMKNHQDPSPPTVREDNKNENENENENQVNPDQENKSTA